jgi:[ribosomal protein S5]-alanine N-acetyltransferase
MKNLQIVRIDVEEIIDLRHKVLRPGLARESAIFDGDAKAVHLAAMKMGKIAGCASILTNTFENESACQLRGMAVDPRYQKQGIGRLLLAEVERIAAEKRVKLLWANCRVPAVEFYRKLGWSVVSEEFEGPTAGPHVKMIRRL